MNDATAAGPGKCLKDLWMLRYFPFDLLMQVFLRAKIGKLFEWPSQSLEQNPTEMEHFVKRCLKAEIALK